MREIETIMTREEMIKSSFKPYMEIHYKHPRMESVLPCILVNIDFDEETMTLQPAFPEQYIREDFEVGIQFCSIPRRNMRISSVNGNDTSKTKTEVLPYEGSTKRRNPYISFE